MFNPQIFFVNFSFSGNTNPNKSVSDVFSKLLYLIVIESLIASGKIGLLNLKTKFNFNYDDKKLEIYNLYFRSKNLSFNGNSTIKYLPFFLSTSTFQIEDINTKILKKINIKLECNE